MRDPEDEPKQHSDLDVDQPQYSGDQRTFSNWQTMLSSVSKCAPSPSLSSSSSSEFRGSGEEGEGKRAVGREGGSKEGGGKGRGKERGRR